MKTLLDILPQMKTGTGFFTKFVAPVWAEDYTNTARLDIFFAMTYGQKHPTPLLDMFVDEDTGHIDNDDLAALAAMIYGIRGNEWEKLYDVLKAEYNPLENTDVYEETRENRAITGAQGNTRTYNETEGNTRTLNTTTTNGGSSTVQSTASGSGSTAANVFGFDSSTAVGDSTGSDSSSTNSTTGTQTANTLTDTGTVTDAGSHGGTVTDSGNNSSSDSFQRIYTKHGNIGVMTPNELLGGTVEMWKWTFIIQIMNDICDLIALKVY